MVEIPRLRARFRVASPLFLGDARQRPEVRAPSFKGVLRSLYRAADPSFAEHEGRLFGGAGKAQGQARVLLRVHADDFQPFTWDRQLARRFTEGYGRRSRNGLIYLGWPFQFGKGPIRTAIPPRTEIELHCVMPRGLGHDDRQRLLTAIWLLGRLGSLGTRARRGFGSLTLLDWNYQAGNQADDKGWQQDMARLPLAVDCSRAQWLAGFESGLAVIRDRWLGRWSEDRDHPHLGPRLRYVLLSSKGSGPEALDLAGRAMQDFRQRREPDYRRVRDYLTTGHMRVGPERAAFGLPLQFQYSSLPRGNHRMAFVPFGDSRTKFGDAPLDRHASLIRIRLVELKEGVAPLFVRMDGAVPGEKPPVGIRGGGGRLEPASTAILDRFFEHLEG